jgi:hypothetical protein
MALDPELKKALTRLPVGEKDKLLLRLIGKDPVLVEKLLFELVEERRTLDDRRAVIRQIIDRLASYDHDTAGWVMMAMRDVSGAITRHIKVTKDSYGEVELTLYMLNMFCQKQGHLLKTLNHRTDKAAQYIAKRAEQVLKKLQKLDADYFIEFERDANQMLKSVHTLCSAAYARQAGLPQTWMSA